MSDEKLSIKDRADLYCKLAESAQDRFNSRRDVEWKVTIALWTLFGAASGAIITARWWAPEPWQVVCICLAVVGILAIYRLWWLTYLAEAFARDQRTSYYWESAVQHLLEIRLPQGLDPKDEAPKPNTWIRYNPSSTVSGDGEATFDKSVKKSQNCQFFMAAAFGMLLILVAIGKHADTSANQKQDKASASINQNDQAPAPRLPAQVEVKAPAASPQPDQKSK